jgi:hypothetical protein
MLDLGDATTSCFLLWDRAVHTQENFLNLVLCGKCEGNLKVYTSRSDQGNVELLWRVRGHDEDVALGMRLAYTRWSVAMCRTSCEAAPSIVLSNALKLIEPEVFSVFPVCLVASLLNPDSESPSLATILVTSEEEGSSSRLRPALSMSSRRTMQRSGRESKSEQSSDSVKSWSFNETQYMSSPKTPANAKEREVFPVPGGPWKRYCERSQ